jgi:hypothetical protein
MAFWLLFLLTAAKGLRVVGAVWNPADLARGREGCGLRPFPWKACGLRGAHRLRPGDGAPGLACPHPFHGAPGRTGPAGLPTVFPPPRPLAGDRCAFSTRPAGGRGQQQPFDAGGLGRAPPSLPPSA